MPDEQSALDRRRELRKKYKRSKQAIGSSLTLAILMAALGIGFYYGFAYLEKEGESFRTMWLLAVLYTLLGKGGVLGLCLLFTVGGVIVAAYHMVVIVGIDKNAMAEEYEGQTNRRCPKCGQLCPEYRAQCKNCRFRLGSAEESAPRTGDQPAKQGARQKNECEECPKCGFGYKWDGIRCSHCGYAAAESRPSRKKAPTEQADRGLSK